VTQHSGQDQLALAPDKIADQDGIYCCVLHDCDSFCFFPIIEKQLLQVLVISTPNLRSLQPGHLDVLPWPDDPVLESDLLATQSLDLLNRPLQQLLPAGVQPHRPWDRL
jgi:hypothetical protein